MKSESYLRESSIAYAQEVIKQRSGDSNFFDPTVQAQFANGGLKLQGFDHYMYAPLVGGGIQELLDDTLDKKIGITSFNKGKSDFPYVFKGIVIEYRPSATAVTQANAHDGFFTNNLYDPAGPAESEITAASGRFYAVPQIGIPKELMAAEFKMKIGGEEKVRVLMSSFFGSKEFNETGEPKHYDLGRPQFIPKGVEVVPYLEFPKGVSLPADPDFHGISIRFIGAKMGK